MKFFKVFLSLLLSLILICSAAVLQLSLSLKHDVINNKFYSEKINNSKIYDSLEKSLYSRFFDYASKNKLPTNATSNIISIKWIDEQFITATDGLISYVLKKTDVLPVIDTKTPIDKFNLSVTQILTSKNKNVDNTVNASKQEFVKSFNVIPFTKNWNDLNGDSLKVNLNTCRVYVQILNFAPFVSGFILLACILLLILTTTKLTTWKLWTGYALVIGGLIPSITSFVLSNSSIVNTYFTDNFIMSKDSIFPPKATINLLTDIVNSLLMAITKYGAILVFLGIALILIVSLFDKKKDNVTWYVHKPIK